MTRFVEGEIYGRRDNGEWVLLVDTVAQVRYEEGLPNDLKRSHLIIPTDEGDFFMVWTWKDGVFEVMRNFYGRADSLEEAQEYLYEELMDELRTGVQRQVSAAVEGGAEFGPIPSARTLLEAATL